MSTPADDLSGSPSWRSARRWRLFAGVWLVYMLSPLSEVVQGNDGRRQTLGVLLVLLFCAVYLAWLPGGVLRENGLRAIVPWLLFVMSLLLLPLSGESGLIAFVFVAVTFIATYPRWLAVGAILVLLVLSGVLPYVVDGWSDDGIEQVVQIALAAAVVLFVIELIRTNEKLREARAELAEMAVLEERERFARDLHDVLGHNLTVITKKAELARRLISVDPERAAREVAEVEQLSREALRDVRATVTGVRETTLVDELATAGQSLAAAGIEAELPREVPDLPVERRVLFGWAVREGVTNVLRHSDARHCRITVSPTCLEVVDDGSARDAPGPGQGLRGLGERAEAIGASVEAGAVAGGGFLAGRVGTRLMIRVLLADDHHLVRGALSALLALEADLEVVAEVGRGDQVLDATRETEPDVAVLDIEMPGMDGIAATELLRREAPSCRVLVVTTFGRPGYLRRAMAAGAAGFMVKDAPAEALADAIRRVHAGLRVVDPSLAAESLSTAENPLTGRERDVLREARGGATVSDVAAALHLSEGTVRNYLSSAIQKTASRTRAEAARIAEERGWL